MALAVFVLIHNLTPQLFAITEIRERKGVVIRPVLAKKIRFLYGSRTNLPLWPLYVIDKVVPHVIYCSQCSKTTLNSVISDVNVGYDVYYGVCVCVRECQHCRRPLDRIL